LLEGKLRDALAVRGMMMLHFSLLMLRPFLFLHPSLTRPLALTAPLLLIYPAGAEDKYFGKDTDEKEGKATAASGSLRLLSPLSFNLSDTHSFPRTYFSSHFLLLTLSFP
jgi:hypothetical protein